MQSRKALTPNLPKIQRLHLRSSDLLPTLHPEAEGFQQELVTKLGLFIYCKVGRVGGIKTGYGLDGPGIESRWGRDSPHTSRPALGFTQPPVQWVPGHSRVKAVGAWL